MLLINKQVESEEEQRDLCQKMLGNYKEKAGSGTLLLHQDITWKILLSRSLW